MIYRFWAYTDRDGMETTADRRPACANYSFIQIHISVIYIIYYWAAEKNDSLNKPGKVGHRTEYVDFFFPFQINCLEYTARLPVCVCSLWSFPPALQHLQTWSQDCSLSLSLFEWSAELSCCHNADPHSSIHPIPK